MNLALKDVRHNCGRFALTSIGIGLLLMIVMGMGGIYRGLVADATLLVEVVGADLWVVQGDTRGPFAEVSRVPTNLRDRIAAVPGVKRARECVSTIIQRHYQGRSLRMSIFGLDWPTDKGAWLPVVAGRALAQNHYELVADRIVGLEVGDRIRLGKETYTVVGLTKGMYSSAGDGMVFCSALDALAIQFDLPAEAIRLERSARAARNSLSDLGRAEPGLIEHVGGPSDTLPSLPLSQVSAVLVTVAEGVDVGRIADVISRWPDVTVLTREQERQQLLSGPVDKSRRQLALFRTLLTIISAIIMTLILYTLTLERIGSIALLKLVGAPNHVILGMILQQALVLGGVGFGVAYGAGMKFFPYFPRRVLLRGDDLLLLGAVVAGMCVLASLLGIGKALRVHPNEILS